MASRGQAEWEDGKTEDHGHSARAAAGSLSRPGDALSSYRWLAASGHFFLLFYRQSHELASIQGPRLCFFLDPLQLLPF